jgi:hypothetical protein
MNHTPAARVTLAGLTALIALLGLAPTPALAQLSRLIVTMTAPNDGALLRGTTTVSADVTIIGGLTVMGVQFKLDGANLGAEDTQPPYSISWNTTQASNGPHTLTAVARDLLGVRWTSGGVSVTVDNLAPAVTINQAAGQVDPTRLPPINFTVVFSEPVSGFTNADVALSGTAGGSKTVAVSGGPATYNVAVSGMTSGTLVATLAAGVATDAAGNPNAASTSSDNTVTFDSAPPTVTINQAGGQADPTGTSPIHFTAVFSEPVSGFTGSDVTITGSAGGSKMVAVSGGPATYNVAVSGMTEGTVIAGIAAGVAQDAAGNANTASTSTDNTVTFTAPTTVTRIQDTSPAITYVGGWVQGNTARPWSGGTAALANSGPAADGSPTRATLSFTGTAVSWMGFRGPQTGIARVFLDGALTATVDTYAPTEALEAVLHTSSGLTPGAHTLAVESTGTRNPSSSDILVIVDAFDVTSSTGPDTTAPTVTLTAPANNATVFATVNVTASATDNVGVAGVQFLLNGAPLGAEDTAAPWSLSWDTTTVADAPYTLTAAARDAAGNTATSAAVTVTVSNASPPASVVATRFEQTDPSVTYTDGIPAPGQPDKWWYGSRSRGWSGFTSAFNRSAGARAIFQFTGTSVSWIGFRAHWAGIARVSVDGGAFTEIDLFEPPNPADPNNGEKAQAIVYTTSGLTQGAHTLVVESTGRKHGTTGCDPAADPANCASDYAVVVDAFDVAPSMPPPVDGTRFEESSLNYTPGTNGTPWSQGDTTRPWSNQTAAIAGNAGARATFSFVGTSVSWIGRRGAQGGIARVLLDGAIHAEVDTYSPTELQAVVFTITGLAAARHTVTIEATGLKNPAATNSLVVVDAMDVRTRIEDNDPVALAYSAGWTRDDAGKSWSGTSGSMGSGTAALGRNAGDTATFTFSGTSVRWISFRSPLAGLADVFVDGTFAARVDLYAATEQLRVPVFTSATLPAGVHTLRIDATGERNPSALASFVVVDALDVTPPSSVPTVTRVQEGDAAITYTPTSDWTRGSRFRFDSSEFAMGSYRVEPGGQEVITAGSKATLRFRAANVRWIGRRGYAGGIAYVRLDGVLVATIETRVPLTAQEEFQTALYTATGLNPSVDHTLEIELTGRNGEPPGSPVEHRVWVDAFDVY